MQEPFNFLKGSLKEKKRTVIDPRGSRIRKKSFRALKILVLKNREALLPIGNPSEQGPFTGHLSREERDRERKNTKKVSKLSINMFISKLIATHFAAPAENQFL